MDVDGATAHLFVLITKSRLSSLSLTPNNRDLIVFSMIMMFILPVGTCVGTASGANRNETDHRALLAIKSCLRDPRGALSSWNRSVHHCSWEGIICGHRHRRVVVLDLSSRGLEGTISPYIGNLSFLHFILLHNNTLKGQIPAEIGLLFRLYGLSLYHNLLVGEIPPTISKCLNLQYLDVSENSLVGRIPPAFGSLSMLKGLYVHRNNLSGLIFSTIQNLTSLEYISASFNAFEGTIPDTIGQMKNLSVLALGSNLLTGIVPPSIYNLSSITILSLHYNQLHGILPTNIASTLPCLQVLNLGGNHFSGTLPVSLSNISSITRIELRKNKFTGKILWDLGHLTHLENLQIDYNLLGSGEADDLSFLTSLVNCSDLRKLVIGVNSFGGELPKAIANLSTKLIWLSLENNIISGTIPAGMSRLSNLVQLDMHNNQLSGIVPSDIGKLHKLEEIALSVNMFTGTIPESLGNLSKLSSLQLDGNNFHGTIPSSLGNCQNLNFLVMTQNNLSGTIPKDLFRGSPHLVELGVAQNQLEGPLPFEVSQQQNLVGLDVSNNKLSGEIQSALGSCPSLLYLYMQGNLFHGHIPASLGYLGSIQEIDLSRNNLSGTIPAYFSKLPLTNLNLSYNDFEGEVPIAGVFANVSAVFLVGNPKLCGGIVELHLPRCRRKEVNRRLKLTISCVCAFVGVAIVLSFYCIYHRKKQRSSLAGSSSLPVSSFREPFFQVSYKMLRNATQGFSSSNLLGGGTFGSVFKGVLEHNQMTVAVKVLNLQQPGGLKSFVAECEALRNVRHRNLVRVLTACSGVDYQGNDFKALVYEFMHGGTLENWLYYNEQIHQGMLEIRYLGLLQRMNIALDVAYALEYLHHGGGAPIVHRDLKPSNILLDNDMVAHVGDFGLAKFLPQSSNADQSSSVGVGGTIGYAAPEYGLGADPSTAGDVYSYGIVVLEMMTAKRPTDATFQEGLNLHTYVKMALPDEVVQIVDPRLLEDDSYAANVLRSPRQAVAWMNCVARMMEIGVACSMESPQDRMNLKDAMVELLKMKDDLIKGRQSTQR